MLQSAEADQSMPCQEKQKGLLHTLQSWSSRMESRPDFTPRRFSLRFAKSGSTSESNSSFRKEESRKSASRYKSKIIQVGSPCVRFSKTKTYVRQEIPITAAEAAAYWYKPLDIQAMKFKAKLAAVDIIHGKLNGESSTPRGLESYMETPTGESAKLSRFSVLAEQTKLRHLQQKGALLPAYKVQERIHRVYTIYTQGSKLQAQLLALVDEVEAGHTI